jgi:hypothetical protein
MADPDELADLDRALAATETVVAGIRAGQWAAPTPCTELDVRGVLNHLVSGNLLFAALVRGEPLPDRAEDHLDGDPLAAFQRAAGGLPRRRCRTDTGRDQAAAHITARRPGRTLRRGNPGRSRRIRRGPAGRVSRQARVKRNPLENRMAPGATYDAIADWYEDEFLARTAAAGPDALGVEPALRDLLGRGTGIALES